MEEILNKAIESTTQPAFKKLKESIYLNQLFNEEEENEILLKQLNQKVQVEQNMFDGFENLLTTQEGLDKLISDQLDDVYNKVNDRVKQHIEFRRRNLLTKKRQKEV